MNALLAVVIPYLVAAAVQGIIALEEEQQLGLIIAEKELLIELAGRHVIAGGNEVEFVIGCSQNWVLVEREMVVDDLLGGAAARDDVMADNLHVAAGLVLLLGATVALYLFFGGAIG